MEKKQIYLYLGVSIIVFLLVLILTVIINYVSPIKIQIYTLEAHVIVQIILFVVSLGIITSGFYYFKKLAKNFDREFNQ